MELEFTVGAILLDNHPHKEEGVELGNLCVDVRLHVLVYTPNPVKPEQECNVIGIR